MRVANTLGAAMIALAIGGWVTSARAVQLADGRVYFVQPPRLEGAVTTERSALAANATYYFTISLPENAGEPLQRIDVVQRDGRSSPRRVLFDPEESRAFVGTRGGRGDELPLGVVTFDRNTQTTTVNFDPPIQPGTTLTVGIDPERNPRTGGVYLFGVTAFPAGDVPYGQFLGYGRIDINDQGDRFVF